MLATRKEKKYLYACPRMLKFFKYPKKKKKKIANTLKMEEIEVPKRSVFVLYGFLQHARTGWKGDHALRYYNICETRREDPQTSVAFAYGTFLEQEVGLPATHARDSEDDEETEVYCGTASKEEGCEESQEQRGVAGRGK